MGYGYAETFLIVFLTHPGVILPTTSSAIEKGMSFVPPGTIPAEVSELIPKKGFPSWLSGLWQALWVWILSAPGKGSAGSAWAMYAVYMLFLFVYMYFFLTYRITSGI